MPSHKKRSASAVLARKKAPKKDEKRLNPFEVRVNKKKHDVLGQKSKSDKGLPGVARSKAMKKRKKTLLVEYKQRNKTNQFVDRRFGEHDDGLSIEEKMMQRFTLERKRKHERSSLFNLDEDNEEGLTHYGQSIGDMERFDHIELSEDEMEEEDIGETHFGGFLKKKRQRLDQSEDADKVEKPRTRKEIMDEVVAKSKAMKYKQQSERQDVEELMDKVNVQWKSLQSLLPKAEEESRSGGGADDYDRTVRELAFERRGQPTDRLKTEEEIAKEEKKRLEKLEADRVRRMRGLVSSGGDVAIDSADYIHDQSTMKKKVQFTLHYKDGKILLPEDEQMVDDESPAVSEDSSKIVESEDGDSDEEGVVGDSGEEGESGDSDEEVDSDASEGDDPGEGVDSDASESGEDGDIGAEYGSDLESDDSEEEHDNCVRSKVKNPILKGHSQEEVRKMKELASRELPYTFSVPKSLEELQTIVADRSPEECLTAVERIHSCNHPSIDPSNKLKLEAFLPVLVDFCSSLGEDLTVERLITLESMARPLFKLSQLNPLRTAQLFRSRLQEARDTWMTVLHGKKYPPLSQLLLFKLTAVIFPTSDFEHPVTTPALIFMGQLLARCQVKTLSDLLSGLFLCQLALEYLCQSKRFMPELVNFLTSVVGCFVGGGKGVFLPPLSSKSSPLSRLTSDCELGDSTLETPSLFSMIIDNDRGLSGDLVWRTGCGVLVTALSSLSRLVELYSSLPSFSELFAPLVSNIKCALERRWPPSVQLSLTETLEVISSRGSKSKGVLQLLKQKPKSIKFYEPKFDEVYEVNRKKARSKSVGERQKLKNKVKKETKGAIREIRRDTAFLAKERLSERLQLDAERAAKTKKILHDLQMGQHEVKQERRKKRK